MNEIRNTIFSQADLPDTQVNEEIEVVTTDVVKNSSKVILFNDEWHTFDDVINQIIKATKCSRQKAEDLTWEVHNSGKAIVFDGEIAECLKVSAILEEIELHTQVEY